MNRDPYPDFADSEGLAEQIAETLERAAIAEDLRPLRGLLRFWNAQGRPLMFFRVEASGSDVETHDSARLYFLTWVMRGACNDG